MQLTGHILDWELFGKRGDRLPPGLIWTYGNTLGRSLTYDPRNWFSASCRSASQRRLDDLGCDSLLSAATQDIESRRGEIHETVSGLIMSSPEYRLVQSFNMQLPPESKDMPLLPFFRIIRERQIEEDVKFQYGIQGAIDARSVAATSLKRRLQWLDDEVMLRKTTAELRDDTLVRARQFFGQKVFDECGRAYNREALDRFDIKHSEHSSYLVIRLKEGHKDPEGFDYVGGCRDYTFEAAEALTYELSEAGTNTQRWIGKEFLDYFMMRLLDPRTSMSYDMIIEYAIEETSAWMLKCFINDMTSSVSYTDSLPVYLRLPEGEEMLDTLYMSSGKAHSTWHEAHSKGLGFTTAEEIARKERILTGEILRRPRDDSKPRLIQSYSRNTQIPRIYPKNDLRLRLTAETFRHGADPHIPGYKLASRNGDEYGFVRDNVDPYTRADIPLSEHQKELLSDQYSQLGLHQLAKSVNGRQNLTVDSLVDLIRDASYYPRPAKLRPHYQSNDEGLPEHFEARQLSDFQQLVKEGVLQVQCNGSAKFLQLSLEAAFGRGAADIAVGNLIGNSKYINASGHAQTTFVYKDHIYLLDATPFSGVRGQGRRFGFWGNGQAEPPSTVTLATIPEVPEQPEAKPLKADPSELRKQRLASLQHALELQLSVLLGVRDRQGLHKKVASLNSADPVRRTLGIFLRAPKDQLTAEDIENLSMYLEQYKKAPADVLAQMRVPAYDAATLDSLIEPVRQLGWHFRE